MKKPNSDFWRKKKVFVTGHTGFKGSWLSLMLHRLGAEVAGYALAPPSSPSLFEIAKIDQVLYSIEGDVRDVNHLRQSIETFRPEIVLHLAAQSLVRESYANPVDTYSTNVMGTVNVLDVVRKVPSVNTVLVVTSDKCYKNEETNQPYVEKDAMGGKDPYSSSKGCAELVVDAYIQSFFKDTNVNVASARAGNVIGGGDWAKDRLITDLMSSFIDQKTIELRYPHATRPWQHVVEPLSGYLLLCERLAQDGKNFNGGWNFGPKSTSEITVQEVVNKLESFWDSKVQLKIAEQEKLKEAIYLRLDSTKAMSELDWSPRWDVDQALQKVADWYLTYRDEPGQIVQKTYQQIDEYLSNV